MKSLTKANLIHNMPIESRENPEWGEWRARLTPNGWSAYRTRDGGKMMSDPSDWVALEWDTLKRCPEEVAAEHAAAVRAYESRQTSRA